jgi:beta-1,4-mannooligosaccharide/beta-1,4-mannosyl-N-acetylglucosamine phosphorylase
VRLERIHGNPIVTRMDVPDVAPELVDATSVFNPGAAVIDGRIVLLLRVQTRGRRTFFMRAESADGLRFKIAPELVPVIGIEGYDGEVYHCYDPRITSVDGDLLVMFAMDTDRGCRLGVARSDDLRSLELVAAGGEDDVRNGVLFPEKLGGSFVRLDRPNRVSFETGVTSGDTIVLSRSDDLAEWHAVGSVMGGRLHYWDELIGPGPPPVKTRDGWLLIYHGIATHLAGACIYQAGAALLNLEDPTEVLARTRDNILEPRELWETTGQVPNVVFPSGMVIEELDAEGFATPGSRVLVYYGAADTCIGVAAATIAELIAACKER